MSSGYYRSSSPGRRRLVAVERSSTGTFGNYDSNHSSRHSRDHFVSPRTSGERVGSVGGVIPISTETFVNPPYTTRTSAVETYPSRARRSTLTDSDPLPTTLPGRSRPATVIHSTVRPSSPLTRTYEPRDVHVATSAIPRVEHKKLYSVGDGKPARLIDEGGIRPRRRESVDRGPSRDLGRDRSSKHYHLTGPLQRPREGYNGEGYSYTDPAGMYRDTEPSWRRRSGSVDRGPRERPVSMLEAYPPPPRASTVRDMGPPPTTRGLDKVNEGLGVSRHGSLRNPNPVRSPTRDDYNGYRDADPYNIPLRSSSIRQPVANYPERKESRDDRYSYPDDYDDRSEPRRRTRRIEDPNVETRGFGIRSSSVDRYAPERDEDANLRITYGADPLVQEPDLRNYIPEAYEDSRRDAERRDRDRLRDHERERDEERDRDRERRRDWERERENDRERGYEPERERDRDRRDIDRADESHISGAVPAAVAAGAAYGAGEAVERHARDRRRDYGDEDVEERPRRRHQPVAPEATEVPRERERERERERHYVDRDVLEENKRDARNKEHEALDPDEEYRRRVQQEVEQSRQQSDDRDPDDSDRDKERRRQERHERRALERAERAERDRADPADVPRHDREAQPAVPAEDDRHRDGRHNSIFGAPLVSEPDSLVLRDDPDRETRVRIVEPSKSPKDSPPPVKGILRKPTEKFPEDPNPIREGVAPLKDASKKGIPPGARWTKIDRRLVNPEALEEAKERFEERLDCVIVLRVLTKDEIQRFADRTREIRDERYERERKDRKHRHRDRERERERDRDSYDDDDVDGDADEGRSSRRGEGSSKHASRGDGYYMSGAL